MPLHNVIFSVLTAAVVLAKRCASFGPTPLKSLVSTSVLQRHETDRPGIISVYRSRLLFIVQPAENIRGPRLMRLLCVQSWNSAEQPPSPPLSNLSLKSLANQGSLMNHMQIFLVPNTRRGQPPRPWHKVDQAPLTRAPHPEFRVCHDWSQVFVRANVQRCCQPWAIVQPATSGVWGNEDSRANATLADPAVAAQWNLLRCQTP